MQIDVDNRYYDLANCLRRVYTQFLEPVRRKWALSQGELDVLLFFANNPQYHRASDMVNHRGFSKAHVSALVAGLEGRGLLAGCGDPADRRAVQLELTALADDPVADGREAQQAFFHAISQGIPEEDLSAWVRVNETVARNLEQMDNS